MSSYVGCPVKYCDWFDVEEHLDAHLFDNHNMQFVMKGKKKLGD